MLGRCLQKMKTFHPFIRFSLNLLQVGVFVRSNLTSCTDDVNFFSFFLASTLVGICSDPCDKIIFFYHVGDLPQIPTCDWNCGRSVTTRIGFSVDSDLHEKLLHRIGSRWCKDHVELDLYVFVSIHFFPFRMNLLSIWEHCVQYYMMRLSYKIGSTCSMQNWNLMFWSDFIYI